MCIWECILKRSYYLRHPIFRLSQPHNPIIGLLGLCIPLWRSFRVSKPLLLPWPMTYEGYLESPRHSLRLEPITHGLWESSLGWVQQDLPWLWPPSLHVPSIVRGSWILWIKTPCEEPILLINFGVPFFYSILFYFLYVSFS